MDKKRVEDALEYAVASNEIEDLKITKSELKSIKEELLKVNDNNIDENVQFEKESVNNGKIRK